MNIAGLNNLALPSKPQMNAAKGAKPSSNEGGEKASPFEDVLVGKASSTRSPAANNPDQNQSVESEAADSESVPGQNLPLGSGAPIPGDRLMTPPSQVNNLSPQQTGKVVNVAANASPSEDNVDGLTRRVVWSDFLRKMKEDLGVSAEDVLHAFSSLSAEDLAKPPAATVDKIVMALGLNDQQAILAKQYFHELITKTQSRSLGEELQTSGKQINLTLMSQREAERKTMLSQLERMNQNFFLTGPYARQAPQAAMPPPQHAQAPQAQLQPVAMQEAPPAPDLGEDLNLPVARQPGGEESSVTKSAANPASTRALNELTAKMQAVDPQAPNDRSLEQVLQKFVNAQAPTSVGTQAAKSKTAAAAAAVGPAAAAAGLQITGPTAPQTAPIMSAHSLNGLLASLNDADVNQDDGGGTDTEDASYLNAPLLNTTGKMPGPLNTAGDFQTQLAQVKPDQPMTVPDLVQQAQVMVRDGGGEMKVTMHPEGLGEVAMRVSVEQGKVNVQMITESDDAKKLIERQLGELKSSLNQNHLQVADIKVDTATNLGKQLEQQYHEAQRQATQAQWEQFRQDNQGWRRSFFETPDAREFKGQGQAPRDVNAPSATSNSYAARARGSSRRLDLVA